MPRKYTCQNCGKIFSCNPRSKKQKYCSSVVCQNERRNITNKKKLIKSTCTRKLRQLRNKRWRDAYPANEYQRQYREDHPKYVIDNRQQQKQRNKKR